MGIWNSKAELEPITRETALHRLRKITADQEAGDRDLAMQHVDADVILLRLIGVQEIADTFDNIGRWYA